MFRRFFLAYLAVIIPSSVPGQTLSDADILVSTPLESPLHPPMADGGERWFEKMPPERTGVTLSQPIDPSHPLARLYPFGWAAGGVAIGDVNGDGKADLFLSGGSVPNRLYLQVGDFQFRDVTALAGVAAADRWCAGAAMADVDNDGDLDLYITCYAEPNLLFLNQSKGNQIVFEEKAAAVGVEVSDGSINAAFADFDRDGALDLYVQTYHLEPDKGRPLEAPEIKIEDGIPRLPTEWEPYYLASVTPEGKTSWTEGGRPDFLLRNRGISLFDDFTGPAGIALGRAYGTSVTWGDFDQDGNPDLYVGHDFADPDLFYRNSGRRNFTQGARQTLPHTPWFSRGAAAADFNNDLLIDLLVANAGGRSGAEDLAIGFPRVGDRVAMMNSGGAPQVFRNTLHINTGAARFIDTAWMSGLAHAGAAWSVKAGDFDNDGWIDVFFANGAVRDPWQAADGALAGDRLAGKTRWDLLRDLPERRESNFLFRNRGELLFDDVSVASGVADVPTLSHASAAGDLDGDGDLDLVVTNAGGEVDLFRNRSTSNRIQLRLQGSRSNSWGVGAEVIVSIKGRAQMRQLYPQTGFAGSDEPIIHFGLGDADQVDRLTIRWPSGAVETLENLAANHRHHVTEAVSTLPPLRRARRAVPMLVGTAVFPGTAQRDLPPASPPQPLAPNTLTRLGPAQAWADLDDDGKPELYLGGSRGHAGRLLTQSTAFARLPQPFNDAVDRDDQGAVFFDADNDGDLDLYVVSGGTEAGDNGLNFRDRLYFNDKLRFLPASEKHLPALTDSGGPVAAADVDRDGDLDLFVGGRLTPGAYPTAPKSRLLINQGDGRFELAPTSVAPGLEDSGMVSGAIWTDFDNDGWQDLILVCDWGSIGVWKNQEGRLVDISVQAGTSELLGRWNGIAGGDIDQDGDIDYVVTNLGLNTGQTASREAPLSLFYGTWAEGAPPMLLETTRDAASGKLLPAQGHEIWLADLPALGERYPTSRDFARAATGLDGLFPAERRASALELSVNTLETGMLINDGSGKFTFTPLPRLAQVSPSYGVVLTDINADGRVDCCLAQNRELANLAADPADSGVGLVLLGTGRPEQPLQPVWPDESGYLVFGPSRSLVAIDLNQDERVDLSVGLRETDPAVFINRVEALDTRPLRVDLKSSQPQQHAAGARVTVRGAGMPDQVAEYHAGGGYLSQSPPTLFFAASTSPGTTAKVSIRWSNGAVTERTVYFD